MTRRVCVRAAVLILLLGSLSVCHAFVRMTTTSGRSAYWSPPAVTLDLRVGCPDGDNSSPWGTTCVWEDAVKDAARLWNAAGAQFTFTTAPADPSARACVIDGLNSVAWISATCTGPFGPEVLAVTQWWANNEFGVIGEADVLLNDTLQWGTWTGPPSLYAFDIHRVVLHELGHVVGLDHPDDHGQTVQAIMNSREDTLEQLQTDDIAGIRAIYGPTQATQTKGTLENPGANATKTGIGIISGWVCDANRVEVEVKGARFAAAYGTDRGDTQSVCGDANNGFVVLINWNIFGVGTHRIRLLADDRELVSRSVTVKTFGTEQLTGKSGTWTLEDWPTAGTETIISWTEALQNIEIVDIRRGQTVPPPDADAAELRKLLGTWRIDYGFNAYDTWRFSDVKAFEDGTPYLDGTFLNNPRLEWVVVVLANAPSYTYLAFYHDIHDDEFGYGTCEYLWFNLVSPTRLQGLAGGTTLHEDGTCEPIQQDIRTIPATGERIRAPQ